jgi:hypothetical protein
LHIGQHNVSRFRVNSIHLVAIDEDPRPRRIMQLRHRSRHGGRDAPGIRGIQFTN